MRWIQKQAGQPSCITEFVCNQMAARGDWQQFRVDYPAFTRGRNLLQLLMEEQHGLCAYTGAGIDVGRLPGHRPRNQVPPRHDYWFKAHIEHLKSQRQCREEHESAGKVVGRDVGEDMDYRNMVAAIEVAGTTAEHFGASVRGDQPLSVIPTRQECEEAFYFFEDGQVRGKHQDAEEAIRVLHLDHATLNRWRGAAIDLFLPERENTPAAELQTILDAVTQPANGQLPEFAFVIAQLARDYLTIQRTRAAQPAAVSQPS
ncbi:MAG: hypothetical protein R3F13_08110 [Prosthecobacter sp.]